MNNRALLIEDHEDVAQKIIRGLDWIDFDWAKDASNAAKYLGFEIVYDEELQEKFRIRSEENNNQYKFVLSDNYLLGNVTAYHLWSLLAEPITTDKASAEYKTNFNKIPTIFPISSVPESLPIEKIGVYKCGKPILKHDQRNPLWIEQLKAAILDID